VARARFGATTGIVPIIVPDSGLAASLPAIRLLAALQKKGRESPYAKASAAQLLGRAIVSVGAQREPRLSTGRGQFGTPRASARLLAA
jgi:hypothetical protein